MNQRILKRLHQAILHRRGFGIGGNYAASGEKQALEYVRNKSSKNSIIFDVGANVGGYSQMVLSQIPDAKIYAFEPLNRIYTDLINSPVNSRIKAYKLALSNTEGSSVIYFNPKKLALTSMFQRQLEPSKQFTDQETIQVTTLDKFCRENSIQTIDFLKLDIEGNEFNCLEGASHMLKEGKIRFIQFEFGGTNMDSKTFLRDFYNLLTPQYRFYRILPKGLYELTAYDSLEEVFWTANYLAELK